MGQYARHVFVCTSGDDRPARGDVEGFVRDLRGEAVKAGLKDVWYTGVKESDLPEIFESHIRNGAPVQRLVYEPGVKGANQTKDAH